jgi:glycosyltransferase involved in cell wall biosynthesis
VRISRNFNMPRFCVVTPDHQVPGTGTGGAEYQMECLLRVLLEMRRHDVYYLAHRVPLDSEPDGYRVVKIGRGNQVARFGYWMEAVPLYRALRKIRPDVIYQRVACGYTGVAAYYARNNRARLIWHVAHDTDVMPEGNLFYGRNVVQRVIEKRFIEYGIRHAHNIVVQTERQAGYLKQYYGRKADAVVRNFHPEPREIIDKHGPLSVVWVANLKPWKRPEVFVRLAERLSDLVDVRFIMVGADAGGPAAWRSTLLQDIARAPNIEYVGAKTQDEVNQLLARAHVFVNTSVEEGYPNTFIQAWMREVPVVSLSVNPDDVLNQHAVGIHAGSEQRLEEAVRLLLADPLLRQEYGARTRRYAMQHHSLRNANVLVELIDTGRVDPKDEPDADAPMPQRELN